MLIVSQNEAERQQFASLIAAQAVHVGAGIIFYDAFKKYKDFANAINTDYMEDLDLDLIASKTEGNTKIIIINSLKLILDNGGHKAFSKFLDYAGGKNCIVIACEAYENNSELLLSDFTTTVFFPCEQVNERFADNYDIFEDERTVLQSLTDGYVYARHGYEELVLKFQLSTKLQTALLKGSFE